MGLNGSFTSFVQCLFHCCSFLEISLDFFGNLARLFWKRRYGISEKLQHLLSAITASSARRRFPCFVMLAISVVWGSRWLWKVFGRHSWNVYSKCRMCQINFHHFCPVLAFRLFPPFSLLCVLAFVAAIFSSAPFFAVYVSLFVVFDTFSSA